MIDFGLLISMALAIGVPSLLAHRWTLQTLDGTAGFADVAVVPGLAGLAVGRLAAVLLDDRRSLDRLSNLLIVRSGVEFWPGVAAAAVVVACAARRQQVRPMTRLVDVAPLAMVGYAAYEAACVFRDGCYGPPSAVGLRPDGVTATMLPVGVLAAVGVVVGAAIVRTMARRGVANIEIVLSAIAVVAGVRAAASVWLPHIGDGLTRQHASSVGVMVASASVAAVSVGVHRHPRRRAQPVATDGEPASGRS